MHRNNSTNQSVLILTGHKMLQMYTSRTHRCSKTKSQIRFMKGTWCLSDFKIRPLFVLLLVLCFYSDNKYCSLLNIYWIDILLIQKYQKPAVNILCCPLLLLLKEHCIFYQENQVFLQFMIWILPGLKFYGLQLLNVNPDRIMPWFGRKLWIIEKLNSGEKVTNCNMKQ